MLEERLRAKALPGRAAGPGPRGQQRSRLPGGPMSLKNEVELVRRVRLGLLRGDLERPDSEDGHLSAVPPLVGRRADYCAAPLVRWPVPATVPRTTPPLS
jgi:hypothetical protein